MVALDSTFLIDLSRGTAAAKKLRRVFEQDATALRVPAAAWVEYLSGFDAKSRLRQQALLDNATIFEPFDQQIAQVACRVQNELAGIGTPLGWHDLQIAATAIHYGEAVVTADERFQQVPGLEVIHH